jgi:hypothetical protein
MQARRITYPTFLSKRIRNSASIWGASLSLESTCVALEEGEGDMVVHEVWRCSAGDAAWTPR